MKNRISIRTLTTTALLFALSVVLMILENLIPPIPTLPPGVKLGLSNVVIMYSLFYFGKPRTFLLFGLKVGFVLITHGVTACFLSAAGGFFSILVMSLLLALQKVKLSYIMISVCAAVTHNAAQLTAASLLLSSTAVFYYTPLLVISGVFMGILTGTLLRVMMPAMKRLDRENQQNLTSGRSKWLS